MSSASYLSRKLWDLDRFGLSPAKIAHRLLKTPDGIKPVFLNSVPKSGTHLLERIICLPVQFRRSMVRTLNLRNVDQYGDWASVLGKPSGGEVLVAHAYFDEQLEELLNRHSYAKYLMVRDPRAMVLSFAHHVNARQHPMHHLVRGMDLQARIEFAMEEQAFMHARTYVETINSYAEWREAAETMVCKFESLVSANQATVLPTIHEILKHGGLDADDGTLQFVASNFRSNKSPTFRRGSTSEWRDILTASQAERINASCSDYMRTFAYCRS